MDTVSRTGFDTTSGCVRDDRVITTRKGLARNESDARHAQWREAQHRIVVALHERAPIGIPPALHDLFLAGVSLLIQRHRPAAFRRELGSRDQPTPWPAAPLDRSGELNRITQIGGC
jgi:hypothetical protein